MVDGVTIHLNSSICRDCRLRLNIPECQFDITSSQYRFPNLNPSRDLNSFVEPTQWEKLFRFMGYGKLGQSRLAGKVFSIYFFGLNLLPPYDSITKAPKGMNSSHQEGYSGFQNIIRRTDVLKFANNIFETALGITQIYDEAGPYTTNLLVPDINLKLMLDGLVLVIS